MKNVIIGAVILMAVLYLSSFIKIKPTEKIVSPIPQPTVDVERTSRKDLLYTNYMGACNSEFTQYSYCKCSFDYLDANYSLDEIIEMDADLESLKAKTAVSLAYNQCSYLYVE